MKKKLLIITCSVMERLSICAAPGELAFPAQTGAEEGREDGNYFFLLFLSLLTRQVASSSVRETLKSWPEDVLLGALLRPDV